MAAVFSVSPDDIKLLTDLQLTDLLRRLLLLESSANGIPLSSTTVSLNIRAADGGEDGRIVWQGGPESTDYIPSRNTLFQCKATQMDPAACKKEVLKKKKLTADADQLKPRVKDALDAGGTYVLFCNKFNKGDDGSAREQAIREGMELAEGEGAAQRAKIRIYGTDRIANWTSQYPQTVVAVQAWLNKSNTLEAQSWDSWSRYQENSYAFIMTSDLKQKMTDLRARLSVSGSTCRLVGLSGLGKTRLALEALRPEVTDLSYSATARNCTLSGDDLARDQAASEIVYIDASVTPPDLVSSVMAWRQVGARIILVVDSCEMDLHERLAREVRADGSMMSLLTMFDDPVPVSDQTTDVMCLEPSRELVDLILAQAYDDKLSKADIQMIADFAEGFPEIAVMLAKARLEQETNVARLKPTLLVNKLVGNIDENARKVISACALFEHVGFDNGRASEYGYVSQHIARIDPDYFYRCAQHFMQRGILRRHGDYRRVVPKPLAVRLAGDWWTGCSVESASTLMLGSGMPDGLFQALLDRFAQLRDLYHARDLVEAMCKETHPYGEAEVMLSEWGSCLYCAFVEVNPVAACTALERVLRRMSRSTLLKVESSRRNLVRALEKLCFWVDTFPEAARLLLRLAEAENESWANNATGQFLQLFHVYLSGTQAPPSMRIELIDEALDSGSEDQRTLAVRALGEALESRPSHRIGGVEIQGGRLPERDWLPQTYGDIFDYWHEALVRLAPIAAGDNRLAELGREKICNSIRGLVRMGLMSDLETTLSTVVEKRGPLWPQALRMLLQAQRYEGPNIPKEGQDHLARLIEMLQPQSLADRLRLVVGSPPWAHEKDSKGDYVDVAATRAVELAEELASDIGSWSDNLPVVLIGEQQQGFAFGNRLGLRAGTQRTQFIDEALSILRESDETGNASVLGGFLSGVQTDSPQMVSEVLDHVASDGTLQKYLVFITCCIKPVKEDLDRVLAVVETGTIPVSTLRRFAYGGVLDHLPCDVVTGFCDVMLSHGSDGIWTALEVLSMYCHGDEMKWAEAHAELRTILMQKPLSSGDGIQHSPDGYEWQQVAERLLRPGNDPDLATHVTDDILTLCAGGYLKAYAVCDVAEPVVSILLTSYRQQVWSALGAALLNRDEETRFSLLDVLRGSLREIDATRLIEALPEAYLKAWCEENGPDARVVAASLVPPLAQSGDEVSISPVAQWLVDRFGAESDMLAAMRGNMMECSGWTGEIIVRWEEAISVLDALKQHPINAVQVWASDLAVALAREITRMRKRQEEHEMGV